jgi:hypothetical protein
MQSGDEDVTFCLEPGPVSSAVAELFGGES